MTHIPQGPISWPEEHQWLDWRVRIGRFNDDPHVSMTYGRCRSGRRFFWAVYFYEFAADKLTEDFGWEETDEQATAAARAAIVRIAAGRRAVVIQHHGYANHKLKEVNKAKRATRPTPDTSEAKPVEYLYGWGHGEEHDHLMRFRIVKKTAKRVFYSRHCEYIDSASRKPLGIYMGEDDDIGFVDRQELKRGVARNRARGWWSADYRLHSSIEDILSREEPAADLQQLKTEMAAAHPDRGGSSEAFIAARARYVNARRQQRHGGAS